MHELAHWLGTYNSSLGLYNAAILTTIFGSFCVSFTVILCWGRLVQDLGPIGGMLSAAIIIGTFWVMNHKLPGFGIHPELMKSAAGDTIQFGLIQQGGHGGAPWIDMGWAVAMGIWVCGLCETPVAERKRLFSESLPRIALVILGGLIGGALAGLVGYTGAELFGWPETAPQHP